ncbi:MAG: sigma-70 family RNA polymerase sigma factor [Chloroflexi bacterium]|nr:sigma-70 family RNA polymerase sigma factor [Chloroflexota bacterium]
MTLDGDAKMPLTDEGSLVERAVRREADAFGQLYECHVDRIYRYVYYRVGSSSEAEDLTEQVFLKAWEAIDRYQHRGTPFAAWLYRLAHNLVVDHYRGKRITAPLEDVGESEEPSVDVSLEVEESLEAEEVRAALSQLNPEHQQLLILRFIEGLSHAEAAEIIGKSEGAARVIQHRALQALARALRNDEEKAQRARGKSADQLPG